MDKQFSISLGNIQGGAGVIMGRAMGFESAAFSLPAPATGPSAGKGLGNGFRG
jgi:hypothetical protein